MDLLMVWDGVKQIGGADMILGVWRLVRMDQQTPFFGARVASFATTFKNRKAVPKAILRPAVI